MSFFEVNKNFKTAAADNNINRIIPPLSLICQREILKILSTENQNSSVHTWGKNYALVNWNWFRYCQILQGGRIHLDSKFTLKEEPKGEKFGVHIQQKYHFSTNPYRYLKIEHVKYIRIGFEYLKSFVDHVINHQETNPSLHLSFEKIRVIFQDASYGLSKELVNLIRLGRPDLKLDFRLYVESEFNQQDKELSLFDLNNKTTFSLETDVLQFDLEPREYNGNRMEYEDIRSWISMLNPKQLFLIVSYPGIRAPFMPLMHSIAKINQRYESVTIPKHPIPLIALYRFLQAPNLHTLDIQLQFHPLFALYSGYKRYGGGNDKDDDDYDDDDDDDEYTKTNLSYQTFDKEYYDKNEDKLNEDCKLFCFNFNKFDNIQPNQPYSRDLWNKCRDLIKNHSTLKYLRISEGFCRDCNNKAPKEFIQDFIEMFVNHKSIIRLIIHVSFLSKHSKQQFLDQCQNNVNNNSCITTIKKIIITEY